MRNRRKYKKIMALLLVLFSVGNLCLTGISAEAEEPEIEIVTENPEDGETTETIPEEEPGTIPESGGIPGEEPGTVPESNGIPATGLDGTEIMEEKEVKGIDENGNIYVIEDTEDPVVQDTEEMFRSAGGLKIVNFRAYASGAAVPYGVTTSYQEYGTGADGYLYGYSAADGAYLGMENGKVKFMQSGVVGLVDASKVQVVNLGSVKSYNRYYISNNNIYHQVTTNLNSSSYAPSTTIGPQQPYMKNGATYYSYDGHYFYEDYGVMISDYQKNVRTNSINPNQPYYNYFQYLPLRGLSKYSAGELASMIDSRTVDHSKMRGTGQTFAEHQNTYGVNALLMASVGAWESGWGTSSISQQKNNLFGLNAVDSSPGESATMFSSVSQCIKDFAETYMSKRYLNPRNWVYKGGFLGDKASGINVSYASDPYWGEKIASLAWMMDNAGGQKDQYVYTIGMKDRIATSHTELNVRKEATTSSAIVYSTGTRSNYAFLILGESGGFYKIQSDPVLDSGRNAVNSSSGVYNASNMYAYVSKEYVAPVSGNVAPVAKTITYRTHVQTYGWLEPVSDGMVSGTEGQAKRAEAIKIQLNEQKYSGSVQYRTHVQTYGWLDWVADGAVSGTEGEYKRMEAIQVRLTGEMAEHYDIYYRVHCQTYGWLDWAKNGEIAGTTDGARRMEAIQIILTEKGGGAPGSITRPFVQPILEYNTHVQKYGWQGYQSGGGYAGTQGEYKRMEAIQLRLVNAKYRGGIRYRTHCQTYGWQNWVSNNQISGTTGLGKRMEAIQICLEGEMKEHYDVYYRVHSQTYGWLDWAKNGESAGTEGLGKRMECIQIMLMPKGAEAPGNTERPFVKQD